MSVHRPRFITFTGVDDDTSLAALHILASQYPIEFGVLFSPRHQGHGGRYPALECVRALVHHKGQLQLAAHLCGGHAQSLIDRQALDGPARSLVSMFDRVQVNSARPALPIRRLAEWGATRSQAVILQCRDEFPSAMTEVSWLFDASGGRGIEPSAWPKPATRAHANSVLKGYAGGITPLNVGVVVQVIGEHDANYWLDMETGVRDDNDRFSLEKCRAVCEAVYGAPTR